MSLYAMLIYALIYTKYIIICNKYNKREKEMMEKNKCDESGNLLNDEDIDRAARSLKAMSHPLRLKILCVLGSEQLSVQQIVDAVGTSQSNISQPFPLYVIEAFLNRTKMQIVYFTELKTDEL